MEGLDINERVSIPGEYGFCFLNTHTYREPVTVHFEYDMHLEDDEESKFIKQLENEKRDYIKKKMHQMKPKIMLAQSAHQQVLGDLDVVEDYPSNDTLAAVEVCLFC